MTPMRPFVLAALTLVAASGCTDFATPAELAKPQLLGLMASPPAIPAGGQSELSVLVAGPEGDIVPAEVSWAVGAPSSGQAPIGAAIGTIVTNVEGRAWYEAPDSVDDELVLAAVEATVRLPDGSTLIGTKAIGVGVPAATANPQITEVRVNGTAMPEGETMILQRSELTTLDIAVAPPAGEGATVSWYATIGELEYFRRTPTEIMAPDDADEGWLYVVYRDGLGGISWRKQRLVVE